MAGTRGPGRSPRRPSGSSRPSSRPGTAARGTPAGRRTRGPIITTRAVVLLGVVILLLLSYTSSLHAWWEQRGEIQDLRAENVMRRAQITELEDTKARWDDPAYVRQQARARFGWVTPGETGYRVIGADGKVQGDVPTLQAPPTATQKQWYESLWDSVQESGRRETAQQRQPSADPDKVLKNE